MGVGFVASLLSPIVDRAPGRGRPQDSARGSISRVAVKAPIADLYLRTGRTLFPILALVALYRLPDFVAGVMANSLYVDLGYTKVADRDRGQALRRLDRHRRRVRGRLLGLEVGALSDHARSGAIGERHLAPALRLARDRRARDAGGARASRSASTTSPAASAGTALIAYMSGLTAAGFSATQYALLSSLYALPGKLVGGISGFIVVAYGYPAFFALRPPSRFRCCLLIYAVRQSPVGGLQPRSGLGRARLDEDRFRRRAVGIRATRFGQRRRNACRSPFRGRIPCSR